MNTLSLAILLPVTTHGFSWGFCTPFSPLGVFVLFVYFLARLEFELKASQFLGRLSTTWAKPPVLFCFSYFSDRISVKMPSLGRQNLARALWMVVRAAPWRPWWLMAPSRGFSPELLCAHWQPGAAVGKTCSGNWRLPWNSWPQWLCRTASLFQGQPWTVILLSIPLSSWYYSCVPPHLTHCIIFLISFPFLFSSWVLFDDLLKLEIIRPPFFPLFPP
jgi:hypothetical protein